MKIRLLVYCIGVLAAEGLWLSSVVLVRGQSPLSVAVFIGGAVAFVALNVWYWWDWRN